MCACNNKRENKIKQRNRNNNSKLVHHAYPNKQDEVSAEEKIFAL